MELKDNETGFHYCQRQAGKTMKLGFSGTRNVITKHQIRWLWDFLDEDKDAGSTIEEVHHGACMGADAEMHDACLEREIPVVVHPPTKDEWLASYCCDEWPGVTVLAAQPYLNRNRAIVGAADTLLAMPQEPESGGGGTWYTVRYAQRMNVPVTIVYGDGKVEKRNGLYATGIE